MHSGRQEKRVSQRKVATELGPNQKHEKSECETVEEANPTQGSSQPEKKRCGSWGWQCLWLRYPATAPLLHLALAPRITPTGPAHQLPRRATTQGPGPSTTNTFHTNPWPLFLPSDVTGLCILTHLGKLDLSTSQELSFLTLFCRGLQRRASQKSGSVLF